MDRRSGRRRRRGDFVLGLFLASADLRSGALALVARYTRSSIADALHADYVRTARAKGLTEAASCCAMSFATR